MILGLLFVIVVWLFIGFMYTLVGVRIVGISDMDDEDKMITGHRPLPIGVYIFCSIFWPFSLIFQLSIPTIRAINRFLSFRL